MKKQLKYILITLAAALVIGLGALLAVLLMPEPADDTSSTNLSQSVMIYEKDTADAVRFIVTNQHGSYEMTPKDSGNFHISELDDYSVLQSYLNTFASTFSALEAKKLVTETPEDLALYGFDEPLATLEARFKDETVTVVLGDTEATTGGYYCKLADSDTVYLLTSGVGGRLLSNKLYYLDRTVTPDYAADEELAFDRLVLSGSVRDEIVIIPTPDAEDDTYAEIFGYEIIEPASAFLNLTTGNDFLTSFFSLSADTAVAIAPDEATLAEYGFDEPYSVAKVESSSGSFTLTVGKLEGDDCYVMNDTEDVIFRCDTDSVPWLESQYQDLVSNIFLVPHIDTVATVEVTTDEKEYVYSITKDVANDVIFAKCNGKTLDSENFQNFYQVLVSCYMEIYTPTEVEGEPYLTITYNYHDGTSDSLKLHTSPEDPRQSLIVYNDAFTDFAVRSVYVEKVIADCERLMNGQDVSTTW